MSAISEKFDKFPQGITEPRTPYEGHQFSDYHRVSPYDSGELNRVRLRAEKTPPLPRPPPPLPRAAYGPAPSRTTNEALVGSPARLAEHIALLQEVGYAT